MSLFVWSEGWDFVTLLAFKSNTSSLQSFYVLKCWGWMDLHQKRCFNILWTLLGTPEMNTRTRHHQISVTTHLFSFFFSFISVLLPFYLKASPRLETLLFAMIHMLKWVSLWMGVELYYFRRLNVPCGKPLIFSACSQAFIVFWLTRAQKGLYTWPITSSDEPVQRGHFPVCEKGCDGVIMRTGSARRWRCCADSFR